MFVVIHSADMHNFLGLTLYSFFVADVIRDMTLDIHANHHFSVIVEPRWQQQSKMYVYCIDVFYVILIYDAE